MPTSTPEKNLEYVERASAKKWLRRYIHWPSTLRTIIKTVEAHPATSQRRADLIMLRKLLREGLGS